MFELRLLIVDLRRKDSYFDNQQSPLINHQSAQRMIATRPIWMSCQGTSASGELTTPLTSSPNPAQERFPRGGYGGHQAQGILLYRVGETKLA